MITWLKLQFILFIKEELDHKDINFFISKGFTPLWLFWMKHLEKLNKDFVKQIKKANMDELEDIIAELPVKSFP